jgi:hypothetical protein
MSKDLGWANIEVSVMGTEMGYDALIFRLKVNGTPIMVLEGLTLNEVIREIKAIYGESDVQITVSSR